MIFLLHDKVSSSALTAYDIRSWETATGPNLWWLQPDRHAPLWISQTLIVPSWAADASLSPVRMTELTMYSWPFSVLRQVPLSISQILIVPSKDPVANCYCEKTRAVTDETWPFSVMWHTPVFTLQILTELSFDAAANQTLSWEKITLEHFAWSVSEGMSRWWHPIWWPCWQLHTLWAWNHVRIRQTWYVCYRYRVSGDKNSNHALLLTLSSTTLAPHAENSIGPGYQLGKIVMQLHKFEEGNFQWLFYST